MFLKVPVRMIFHRCSTFGAQELACSLNASSPGLPLLVLTVAGGLTADVKRRAAQLGTLVPVDDVRFPNNMRDGRWVLRTSGLGTHGRTKRSNWMTVLQRRCAELLCIGATTEPGRLGSEVRRDHRRRSTKCKGCPVSRLQRAGSLES